VHYPPPRTSTQHHYVERSPRRGGYHIRPLTHASVFFSLCVLIFRHRRCP
jgi:hypothetical protein